MSNEPLESVYLDEGTVPDDAPEADVVEQHQSPGSHDTRDLGDHDLPIEADPADVHEQRRAVDDAGEDDYR